MRSFLVARILGSTLWLGVMVFLFSVAFPPLDALATVDLSLHMVQHMLVIAGGALIGSYLFSRGTFLRAGGTSVPKLGLLGVIVLLAFWHLPGPWDGAVLNPLVHAAEHGSFLLVGFLLGSVLRQLSDYSKVNALILGFFAHMVYGIILISPLQIQVYPLYGFAQQANLAFTILAPGPAYWAGVVYILSRNRAWFSEGHPPAPKPAPDSPRHGRRTYGRAAVFGLSLVVILTLAAYYATTAAAIGLARPAPGPATVYIVETPVSWQFSPQKVRVVIGVNSTVTWVSQSISYDTVTERNGYFSSGTIGPGQTFAFTFETPGTYEYRCIYHPWMVGTVVVLGGTSS